MALVDPAVRLRVGLRAIHHRGHRGTEATETALLVVPPRTDHAFLSDLCARCASVVGFPGARSAARAAAGRAFS